MIFFFGTILFFTLGGVCIHLAFTHNGFDWAGVTPTARDRETCVLGIFLVGVAVISFLSSSKSPLIKTFEEDAQFLLDNVILLHSKANSGNPDRPLYECAYVCLKNCAQTILASTSHGTRNTRDLGLATTEREKFDRLLSLLGQYVLTFERLDKVEKRIFAEVEAEVKVPSDLTPA